MKKYLITICVAVLGAAFLVAQGSPKELKPLTQAEIDRITAALPEKAETPAKERKILSFWLCQGFYHDSLRYINVALDLMGKKTGAFTVTNTDKMEVFDYATLSQFDAVVFNNSTMLKFENTNYRAALLKFVKEDGKGAVAIHAGLDNFYTFPEAAEMMGGIFDAHPWTAGGTWVIKNDLPEHPLNRAFGGKGFSVKEELYQFKTPYSRDIVKVLLTIDMKYEQNRSGSAFNPESVHRMDEDFAVSWLRESGKGRVFYCGIGHNPEHTWNKAVLQHYLDGIQYALGDFPADAAPVKNPVREAGTAYADLDKMTEDVLAAKLTSTSDIEVKLDICRILKMKATCASVPALASLLSDARMSHVVRYVLEALSCDEAAQALRSALGSVSDIKLKAGIISSLGERRDASAVPVIAQYTANADAELAKAALIALGRIGTVEAAAKLAAAPRTYIRDYEDACLICADTLVASSNNAAALKIYTDIQKTGSSVLAKIGGYRGMVTADPANAKAIIKNMLDNADISIATTGALCVADLKEPGVSAYFAGMLKTIKPQIQVVMLASLASLGDRKTGDKAAELLDAGDEDVASAAAKALLDLGTVSHVKVLVVKAGGSGKVSDAALDTVSRLSGKDIDTELVKLLKSGEKPVVPAAAKCLARRQTKSAVPALIDIAKAKESSTLKETFKALLVLADESNLSDLVALLKEYDGDERVKDVIAGVYTRVANRSKFAGIFTAAYAGAQGGFKTSLLPLLAMSGGADELALVAGALKDADSETQTAAVKALAEWPNDGALEPLWTVVQTPAAPAHKILALRGYARALTAPSLTRSAAETLAMLRNALTAADRDDEKRMIIGAIAVVYHPDALAVLKEYSSDKVLGKDAEQAYQKLKKQLESPPALYASHNDRNIKKAMDNDIATRWDSGKKQEPGMWFMADCRYERTFDNIKLDTGASANDFPNAYEVYISNSTNDWKSPVVKGEGKKGQLVIPCNKARGQYVKVVQTGSTTSWFWSIHEFSFNVKE